MRGNDLVPPIIIRDLKSKRSNTHLKSRNGKTVLVPPHSKPTLKSKLSKAHLKLKSRKTHKKSWNRKTGLVPPVLYYLSLCLGNRLHTYKAFCLKELFSTLLFRLQSLKYISSHSTVDHRWNLNDLNL